MGIRFQLMLTDLQFDRSRGLALRLAGIELFERHRELLHRPCRYMGMSPSSLDSLLNAAEQGDLTAGRQVVNLVVAMNNILWPCKSKS